MTTLTLSLDLADTSGIELAIHNLTLLLGKGPQSSAPAREAVSGQRTVPAGAARGVTAGASTPAAQSAAAQSQASTAATGEQGNDTPAGQPAAASTASSTKLDAAAAPTFDEVKKAFLALSTKPNGRALCEGVLKPFALAKLTEAKVEQYGALKAAIDKAAT